MGGLVTALGLIGCEGPPATAPDPVKPAPAAKPEVPKPEVPKPGPARLTDFEPSTPEQVTLLEAAKSALDAGDNDRATAAFEQLANTGPISGARTTAAIALADIYTEQGKIDEAVALLSALQKKAPPHAELAYVLGRAQKAAGKREAAIFSYREALRHQPLLLQAHIEIGGMYGELGETDLAAKAFLDYETSVYRYAKILDDPAAHPTDKIKICDAFSFLPDDRAAESLLGALDDAHPDVRVAAATAVAEVGTKPMLPRLRELLAVANEKDPRLAKALTEAIAKIEVAADDGSERIGPGKLDARPADDEPDAGPKATPEIPGAPVAPAPSSADAGGAP